MKLLVKTALLLMFTGFYMGARSQTTKDTAAVIKMIADQQYVFKAETVIPMGGRTIHLTPDYDVKVTKESVQSYLPFFGRAYSANIGSAEGGIKFNSKKFEYTVTEKRGGWDILIKPKDVNDVQSLTFSIFTNGSASLNVNSTNRQAISYSGYIEAPRNKNKK